MEQWLDMLGNGPMLVASGHNMEVGFDFGGLGNNRYARL